ncbi:MAG TPA: phosphate ABC transporter substrate-binding protein PstS [Burkholderiales bacterium]|nr:phosphate ABC transporter substrate-binding protein PstS [Burkholderiales bacterium]
MQIKNFAIAAACFAFALTAQAQDKIRLVGSGASFPAPIYLAWFKEISKTGVTIDYQSKGSGAGVQDLINKTVDFAASDSAMTDEQIAKVPGGVVLLPMTAGEVVISYNLPGVKRLNLPRDVYPQIFLGKITKWNDPKIVAANKGETMPDLPITVVRRADSSGTTFVFTNHLSAINEEFKKGPGEGNTVNWPKSDKFIASPKNDGVTATIRQTKGAVGYIEYAFAKFSKMDVAYVQNKAGNYVAPGTEGGAAALANAKFPPDMRLWLSDPTGDKSYPIATYTWMLFYKKYDDPKKAAAIKKMIEFGLGEGQKMADKMGYLPMPAPVAADVRKAAGSIN